MKAYYTLAILHKGAGRWSPEFGDYSRAVVQQELRDIKDGSSHTPGDKYKIVTSDDTQEGINKAIRELNAPGYVPVADRGGR